MGQYPSHGPGRGVLRPVRSCRYHGADLRRHDGHGLVFLSDEPPVRGGHARPAPAAGDPVLDPLSHRLGHADGRKPAGGPADGRRGPADRHKADGGAFDVAGRGHPAGPVLYGAGHLLRHDHRMAPGGAGAVRRGQRPGSDRYLAGPAAGQSAADWLCHSGCHASSDRMADAGIPADPGAGPDPAKGLYHIL